MKFKKILTLSLSGLLISSCAIQLPKELEDFISTFSIEQSFTDYKEAKYVSTWIIEDSSGVKKETDDFYFNVKDINNMKYARSGKVILNGVETTSKYEACFKENDKYYFECDGQKVEYADTQVSEKISQFFYTQITQEVYHSGGIYYGDFVLDNIRKAQKFYSIETKSENESLLKYAFEEKDVQGIYTKITFYVNKLGMLENYSYLGNNGTTKISQEIVVQNIK